jgi:hypothetical protein
VAGLLAWAVIVSLFNLGLEHWLPGYREAQHGLAFTLPMKIARLTMAALTSVLAGAVVRSLAPRSAYAAWITGLVVLALFLPSHIQLWHRFPLWYHLTFLVPLVPLMALGSALAAKLKPGPAFAPGT